ncbi:MAG: hypothetical protein ACI91B_000513, partial [Planctomycetota bacterium]
MLGEKSLRNGASKRTMTNQMIQHLSLTRCLTQSAALVASLSLTCIAGAQDAANESNGFLTGLRGFEHFHEPIGQPVYFETPFNDTGVRALYLKHDFANGSALGGGDLKIYAMQARIALSDRWQFIATKDGYSQLSTGLLGNDEGWNDIGFGLKYVVIADR